MMLSVVRRACLLAAAVGVAVSLANASAGVAVVPWLAAACFAGAWFLCCLASGVKL